MLENFSMKGVASFMEEACEFKNLSKVNIIYGSNGTGKTTVSSFLQHPEEEKFKDCKMQWKDDVKQEVMVYNKTFRNLNIKETDIPGVFTLGSANTEQIEFIDKKRAEKEQIELILGSLRTSLQEKQKFYNDEITNLKEWMWKNLYKKYPMFSEVYPGFKTKEHFYSRIIEEYKKCDNDTPLSLEELTNLHYKLFKDNDLTEYPLMNIVCPTEHLENIEKDPIWKRRIVGKTDIPISKLINELNISDWVYEGRKHIQEDSDICPFCQAHTLTADMKSHLEEFFDREFSDNLEQLKRYRDSYKEKSDSILKFFSTQIESDKNNNLSFLNAKIVDFVFERLNASVKSNLELIEKKIDSPSSFVELQELGPKLSALINLFEQANDKIKENNNLFHDKENQRKKLKSSVWAFLSSQAAVRLSSVKEPLINTNRAIKELNMKIASEERTLVSVQSQLVSLEDKVTSIIPTITHINEILRLYGITSFKLALSEIKKNCYQLVRPNGEPVADSLSEGEETFISFLYFMQMVKGALDTEKLDSDRIVVIDDPVSSLDSGILFAVSSMIKELMKTIKEQKDTNKHQVKQIILLTHNVYFHKEVSFQDRRYSSSNSETSNHYWILRKQNNRTSVEECRTKNPIKSSYELLWRELRENKNNMNCITVQNIMRRILENYFTIFGNYRHIDRIIAQIDDVSKKEAARTLLVWSNDGSHSLIDDVSVESSGMNTQIYYDTLRMIFEELKQEEHYNMMMREEDSQCSNYIR